MTEEPKEPDRDPGPEDAEERPDTAPDGPAPDEPTTGEPADETAEDAAEPGEDSAAEPDEPADGTPGGADTPGGEGVPGERSEVDDELAALLAEGERDLVAEYRERAARAEAELVNFRMRVERDRAANREAVVAEVIRALLPVLDDLDRAEAHGDLVEGGPLTLVAEKLRATFERLGLKRVGEKGEPFDPKLHDAIMQVPASDVTEPVIADVIEPGYLLGERLIRAAKVAVNTPE